MNKLLPFAGGRSERFKLRLIFGMVAIALVAASSAQGSGQPEDVGTIYPGDVAVKQFAGAGTTTYTSLSTDIAQVTNTQTCEVKALAPGTALLKAEDSNRQTSYAILHVGRIPFIAVVLPADSSKPEQDPSLRIPVGSTAVVTVLPKEPSEKPKEFKVAYSQILCSANDANAIQFSVDGSAFSNPLNAGTGHHILVKASKQGSYFAKFESGGAMRTLRVQAFVPTIEIVPGDSQAISNAFAVTQHGSAVLHLRVMDDTFGVNLSAQSVVSVAPDNNNVGCFAPKPASATDPQATIDVEVTGLTPGDSNLTISTPGATNLSLKVQVSPVVTAMQLSTQPLQVVEGDEVRVHVDYLDADNKLVKGDPPLNPQISLGANTKDRFGSEAEGDRIFAEFVPGIQTGAAPVTGNDLRIDGIRWGTQEISVSYPGITKAVTLKVQVIPQLDTAMTPADETKSQLMFGAETCREFYVEYLTLRNNLDKASTPAMANHSMTVYGNSMLAEVLVERANENVTTIPSDFKFKYDGFAGQLAQFSSGASPSLVMLYPPTLYPELSATKEARENRDQGATAVRGIGYIFQIASFLNNAYSGGANGGHNTWNPFRYPQDGSRISLYQTLVNGFTSAFTGLKSKEGTLLTSDFVLTNTQTVGAGSTVGAYVFFPKSLVNGVIPNRKVRIITVQPNNVRILYTIVTPAPGSNGNGSG